ncbi:MAG: ribose-phosphate pyrophosphokinase [Alphaproteobacteria bacterium]|nr:ribose-phosphate pyrophosphokinase [Alphaproteobacteria bacterium]
MINILSSNNYKYIKQNLLEQNHNFVDINIETQKFPDGEHYWKIENCEKIKGNPAIYICGTINDEAIFELYNVASTLVREQCSSLHLILPYFGYSTMERAVKDGEVVTAKNIACLLSSIPISPQGNFIYMMDLHSLGTQYYFEKSLHPIHLTSWSVIKQMISDCGNDVILASADMGRAKWIEKMGNQLGIDTAYIMKKRISGSETEVEALNAEVQGKDVIIFDDMIRSGSSIIKAAEAYKKAGANDIYVVVVHGVFVNDAVNKMESCGFIKQVLCTNSHVNAIKYQSDFVKVYDISPIICAGLSL